MLIRNILEESVRKFDEVKAVKWLKKKEIMERSYGELMENVVSTRKGLLAEGFEGKHIALIGTSSVEWMESYLGIITGCTTAVPLDAALPCEDLIDLLNRSDSAALFLSPKLRPYLAAFLGNCPKLQKVWMLQEEVEDAPAKVYGIGELRNAGKSASSDSVCPDAEDIATIIFTSGTTGKSKGVMLTQNNLASNVEAVKITAEPGTAVLSVLPIHHAFCLVMDWLKGFSLGATLCINDSLLHMVRNMSIFKPEIMLMVPMMIETIYKRLAAADPSIPKAVLAEKVFGGKLRIIFTGGAHLDPYYIDRFAEYGVEVLEGYGMSECSPVISNNTLENNKKGSIGKPLENAEIRFENGEILVKGSSVMKGYYQMPDETAETLKDGWLHTGDKGYTAVLFKDGVNANKQAEDYRKETIRIDKDSRLTLHLASGGGFAMKLELCPVHGQVTGIPEGKNIPSFYQKYIETEGLYVTSSGKVSDEALLKACDIISLMLAKRPDVKAHMVKKGCHVMIIGKDEETCDLPEFAHICNCEDSIKYWNWRARGFGGAPEDEFSSSCGEENLLALPQDKYVGENILIHEFAHLIHTVGIVGVEPDFNERLEALRQNTIRKGLWEKTYAVSNKEEYFAECVQSFFNCNRYAEPANGVHNWVNRRTKLKTYDPDMYRLLQEYFYEIEIPIHNVVHE